MNYQKKTLFCLESLQEKPICGIDEAGRGPIAGPLVMAGVILYKKIANLNDSKALNSKNREILYQKIIQNSKYFLYEANATKIDTLGVSKVISQGLEAIKEYFGKDVNFIFDGNSTFGVSNINTIIKADQKIPEVMAASILAKVHRDKIMKEFAKKYPNYGFEKHKGYATKEHIQKIATFGYTPIHRKSFKLKSLQKRPTLF